MIDFSQRTGETNGCCNIRTIQKKIISGLPIEQKNAGMYAAKRTFRHFFCFKASPDPSHTAWFPALGKILLPGSHPYGHRNPNIPPWNGTARQTGFD